MKSIINNVMLAGCLLFSLNSAQASQFDITLSFSGLTAEQESYFTTAANLWESIITGYGSDVTSSRITGITVFVSATAIDGVNGVLGSTGISSVWNGPGTGGYVLAQTGNIQFDTADIANMIGNSTFTTVIEHEMAHALGFGTLWEANRLYIADSGQYAGSYGLAAYQSEFSQANATYVPVELEGGSGTANGHWNETLNGSSNTGIVSTSGKDMRYELMTGWLNMPTFLSNTTIQSFRDLGYTVVVPLPGAVWLFVSSLILLSSFSCGGRLRRERS